MTEPTNVEAQEPNADNNVIGYDPDKNARKQEQ